LTHSTPSPARPLGAGRAPRGPIEGPRERERIRTAGDLFDPHRTQARNLETAARADRLGLPEYFAMEAYVVSHDGAAGS
jgi:hypothetical protein